MKLVSFYSDTGDSEYYSSAARRLIAQCNQLDVDHYIVEQDFGDTWIDNVRAKPTFLLETIKKLNEPILWLDCDSYILKSIDFNIASEWAVRLREDGTPHDYVHYINNSESNINFLNKWISEIESQKRGSHTAFISIFNELKSEILPDGYFEIGLAETDSKNQYFRENP